ncbi:alpha/beta hydrolase [uncultured Pontibacter sp.]|uniref:alpha/beta fold hydrolase n=1 Tax=uncultured Pontibacter sp. TaxID=453356 RepID=UPI00261906F1|nr:alpha/beta hydrolase [uncultured Pontibacter sp.]
MQPVKTILILIMKFFLLPAVAFAQVPDSLNATLDGYQYPYEVKHITITLEGQPVKMAYMDVAASKGGSNAPAVMLLHGKNFFGAYWRQTIDYLSKNGFRVIVPDQVGFGKSDKPEVYYNFHQLAQNTQQLLKQLGVQQIAVVGHSMGGMLATRFALMYPETTTKLVLENPIGLEDYRLFVPFKTLDQLLENEKKTTEESIRKYHQTYYTSWKPAYDEWVKVPGAQTRHTSYAKVAEVAALTYAMIYQQPVVYEFEKLKVPTLLIIGQQDRTIVGKGYIEEKQKLKTHGQYPQLGRSTAKAIPGAKLVELPNVGHIPHLEATDIFHQHLLPFLK